jgi:chromatin segregation and condensation protein Rec8/ScpA/Scc1 (kleisin family)
LRKEEKIPFSRYATKNDYVAKLWGLLNLAYDGKAVLQQNEPFGEIYFGSSSACED